VFAYVIRRLLATIPVMGVVAIFVFSLLYITPGDPAAVIAGDIATAEDIARIHHQLGLDEPFLWRFGGWLWGVLRGDLGISIFTNLPVAQLIGQRLEPTLALTTTALVVTVIFAIPLGVIAAWKVGTCLMSIPPVLLAIALMALTKASVENVIIAITISEVPRVARLVRGVVLSLREQPFVEAAVAAGTGFFRTLSRHILPNTVAPVLVQATYICASAMITEAVLSFIGAGTPPQIPSWGNIMAEGRSFFQIKPYLIIFPGIFLSLTVLAVNLVGDGLRDALDPRLARRM